MVITFGQEEPPCLTSRGARLSSGATVRRHSLSALRRGVIPAIKGRWRTAVGAAAGAGGRTIAVQNLHRVAWAGIRLRHSGHSRSVASLLRWVNASSLPIGATSRKYMTAATM